MSRPHEAYAKAAKHGSDPREIEASVLMKAAARFNQIKTAWTDSAPADLDPALLYNRTIWTVFATSVTETESQLPKEIRQNIANLAVFVFKRTLEIQIAPTPEMLDVLININRQIAAGLIQRPA
ncbi:MAG: flagellar biosynthesis regulator FlaF [Parvibaculum sp.]|nr:flagellar biosynthesis regulator FlaF [Parvibaculum sp.]|tara:strand:- start:11868 stop:12239 length:372 start_codon:yes stop_codon:yes gene_type:complete